MVTQIDTISRRRLQHYLFALAVSSVSLGLGFGMTIDPPTSPPAVHAGYVPNSGETCFATFDNGTTVFSSTTSSALQQAVDAATPGMTVKVAGTCPGVAARAGVTQTVYVSQSLTIQGGYSPNNWSQSYPMTQPTTLDAMSGGRVLYLTGNINVTIDGVNVTGGNAKGLGGSSGTDAGGGLYNAATSATVQHSTFITNTGGNGNDSNDANVPGGNGGVGGAVYNGGSLVLIDSTLTGNRAGNGGGNSLGGVGGVAGSGGAIYNANALTIVESSITGNFAGGGGYAIVNAQFPGGQGGGILSTGSLSVISSTVNGNGSGNGNNGGGISNQGTLTVTNSTLSDNHAGDGGASYHSGAAGGRGGGISNAGTLAVQGTTFANNSAGAGTPASWSGGAGGDGGGIYSTGSLTVRSSIFTNNSSGAGGGGFLSGGGHGGDGGGIYSSGSLTVSESIFRNNLAAADGLPPYNVGSQGGGIAVVAGSTTLYNNRVIANQAGRGGGVYLSVNAVLTNTVIADNHADVYGSGIVLSGGSSGLWHTTIARNSGGDGTGVYVGGSAALTNTIIVSHSVGITITVGSTATVNSVLWYGNPNGNTGGPGSVMVAKQFTGPPAFVNSDASDYHLTAGSAALDRGIPAGVKFDLDGTPRDLPPDDGAYEYPFPSQFYFPQVGRNAPSSH